MASWTIGPRRFDTVWRGRATGLRSATAMFLAGGLLAGSAAVLIVLATSGISQLRVLAAVTAVALAAGALFCVVEVVADLLVVVRISVDSIEVRPGLLPLGGVSIPTRIIRTVRVVDAPAMPWRSRGWCWACGPDRAVLVRSGPALLLGMADGGVAMISVDEPEIAAQVLRRVGLPHVS